MKKLFALALLASCAANPMDRAKPASMEDALAPPILSSVRAVLLDTPTVIPRAVLIYGRTACAGHRGINPLAILGKDLGPRVGREWRVLFVTSACPFPTEPDWPAWILVSARPMPQPIDWSPFGMPGCWLLVNPDQIVTVPPFTGGMFIRNQGQTTLRWTPTPGSAGLSHWFQFVCLSPSGLLSAPAVEVTVGTGTP